MPQRVPRQAVETDDQAFAGGRAVIIGSSGGIGRALADELQKAGFAVDRLSRSVGPGGLSIDVTNELSVAAAASALSAKAPYQMIIVATSAGRKALHSAASNSWAQYICRAVGSGREYQRQCAWWLVRLPRIQGGLEHAGEDPGDRGK